MVRATGGHIRSAWLYAPRLWGPTLEVYLHVRWKSKVLELLPLVSSSISQELWPCYLGVPEDLIRCCVSVPGGPLLA